MGLPPPPGGTPPLPPPPSGPPPGGAGPAGGAGPVPIRPLNLADVLDGAFKLFVANWRTIVLAAGVFLVPVQLVSAYLQRDLPGLMDMVDAMSDPAAVGPFTGMGNFTVLLAVAEALLVYPLVTGVVAAVAGASYLGHHVEVGDALRAGLLRWWSLVGAWLLLLLASVLPLVVAGLVTAAAGAAGAPVPLVVVLGILLVVAAILAVVAIGTLFAAAVPAIAIERLGAVAGLRRSAGLLRPRLLPAVGTVVVAALLVSVLSMALGGIPQFAGLLVGDPFGWILLAAGYIASSLVTTPLLAIVWTLLYFDGRVRHEALDLQLAAEGLTGLTGAGGSPGGPPGG